MSNSYWLSFLSRSKTSPRKNTISSSSAFVPKTYETTSKFDSSEAVLPKILDRNLFDRSDPGISRTPEGLRPRNLEEMRGKFGFATHKKSHDGHKTKTTTTTLLKAASKVSDGCNKAKDLSPRTSELLDYYDSEYATNEEEFVKVIDPSCSAEATTKNRAKITDRDILKGSSSCALNQVKHAILPKCSNPLTATGNLLASCLAEKSNKMNEPQPLTPSSLASAQYIYSWKKFENDHETLSDMESSSSSRKLISGLPSSIEYESKDYAYDFGNIATNLESYYMNMKPSQSPMSSSISTITNQTNSLYGSSTSGSAIITNYKDELPSSVSRFPTNNDQIENEDDRDELLLKRKCKNHRKEKEKLVVGLVKKIQMDKTFYFAAADISGSGYIENKETNNFFTGYDASSRGTIISNIGSALERVTNTFGEYSDKIEKQAVTFMATLAESVLKVDEILSNIQKDVLHDLTSNTWTANFSKGNHDSGQTWTVKQWLLESIRSGKSPKATTNGLPSKPAMDTLRHLLRSVWTLSSCAKNLSDSGFDGNRDNIQNTYLDLMQLNTRHLCLLNNAFVLVEQAYDDSDYSSIDSPFHPLSIDHGIWKRDSHETKSVRHIEEDQESVDCPQKSNDDSWTDKSDMSKKRDPFCVAKDNCSRDHLIKFEDFVHVPINTSFGEASYDEAISANAGSIVYSLNDSIASAPLFSIVEGSGEDSGSENSVKLIYSSPPVHSDEKLIIPCHERSTGKANSNETPFELEKEKDYSPSTDLIRKRNFREELSFEARKINSNPKCKESPEHDIIHTSAIEVDEDLRRLSVDSGDIASCSSNDREGGSSLLDISHASSFDDNVYSNKVTDEITLLSNRCSWTTSIVTTMRKKSSTAQTCDSTKDSAFNEVMNGFTNKYEMC